MITRRETLAWLARALLAGATSRACGSVEAREATDPGTPGGHPHGYGRDPSLLRPFVPWPLTLTAAQRRLVTRLADLMLPADERSPAASTLELPAFIDEWISAPYPEQRADRELLRAGLLWLDRAASGSFEALDDAAARRILDRICDQRTAADRQAAAFFARLRHICLTGYYTTAAGVADLGYVGYQPSSRFAGPPPEVLARLQLPPER